MTQARTGTERVAAWNEQYPIGTAVEYLAPTAGDRRRGRTRSLAVERDGVEFVLVEGCDQLVQLGNVLVVMLEAEDKAIVDQLAAAAQVAIDEEFRLGLELDTLSAFVLLGALQLVLRHPLLNDEAVHILRKMATDLQAALPRELGELADLGWDPDFDARAEPLYRQEGSTGGTPLGCNP